MTGAEKTNHSVQIQLNSLERRQILLIAEKKSLISLSAVSLSYGEEKPCHEADSTIDHVQEYASEVLSLGLMLMEFKDAVKEGDGLRILRCWRYILLFFKVARRSNYSIEAFNLLAQYTFLMCRLLLATRKCRREEVVKRQQARKQRQQIFCQRQAQQRPVFVFMLKVGCHGPCAQASH